MEEIKKPTSYDYTNAILVKEYREDLSGFSTFYTHKYFSGDEDTCLVANVINLRNNHKLSNKCIFDFYYEALPEMSYFDKKTRTKKSKFISYPKSQKEDNVDIYIARYYNCSPYIAKQFKNILKQEDVSKIVDLFEQKTVVKG